MKNIVACVAFLLLANCVGDNTKDRPRLILAPVSGEGDRQFEGEAADTSSCYTESGFTQSSLNQKFGGDSGITSCEMKVDSGVIQTFALGPNRQMNTRAC